MLRYAITDLSRSLADPAGRAKALREAALRWVRDGIDFVQLREKTLSSGEVLRLAEELLAVRREVGGNTRLLLNTRADVAVAAGADGVHLTSAPGELTPEQVRAVFTAAGLPRPVISASCHSLENVAQWCDAGANLILFGPVFAKVVGGTAVAEGGGLEMLRQAVGAARDVPVLALGGVTGETTAACMEAGAAGVAAIRMFAGRLHRPTTE